jgi:myo-inositol-1(or 4)-monophosphatase
MKECDEFVQDLARKAGRLLCEKLNSKHRIRYKGTIDLVTEADKMAEKMIIEAISRRFPDHGILSEESAERNEKASLRWIVDPLDGTTNYAHGFPFFCVSIALEQNGRMILGVVYDPIRDELFVARHQRGASLNGRRIRVSKTGDLSKSLLATGFPYDIRESKENNLNYFNAMALQAQAVRRPGAAALDLAYLAAGRLDGFWELKLKPWDTAAGCLLVEEAGGVVTDLKGRPWTVDSPGVIGSNGLIHDQMIKVIQKAKKSNQTSKRAAGALR